MNQGRGTAPRPAPTPTPTPTPGGHLADASDGDGDEGLLVYSACGGYLVEEPSSSGTELSNADAILLGTSSSGYFGMALSGGKDIDNDGTPDVVTTATGVIHGSLYRFGEI